MHRVITLLVLAALCLPGLAEEATITPREARASAEEVVTFLVELHTELADEYFHGDDWDKAVGTLDRAITLKPVGTDTYANAAWLLWSSGKAEQAMNFYNRMITANPDDPEAYYIVATYYTLHKDDSQALPWLERAVALHLPSPKRHTYGHTLARMGRTAEALAFWQRVLAEEPGNEVAIKEIQQLTGGTPAPTAPVTTAPAATAPPVTPEQ